MYICEHYMDNFYLQELINETYSRGGGLLLNYEDKPAVVVLTVERYNEIINGQAFVRPETDNLNIPMLKKDPKKFLVTGGAGYIGSHLVFELIKAGREVTVLDNLSTGRRENIHPKAIFVEGDLADENLLRDLFAANRFDAVFHMAASLEVEESVLEPQKYFENNVVNTIKLLKAMTEADCKKLVFSSSAAVYGEPEVCPITESAPLRPGNPYGSTKLLCERAIKYYCEYLGLEAVAFRYFNACGFNLEAKIIPTHQSHLIYHVMQVAAGKQPSLNVLGNDYPTFDGTGVRDYVHVLDIVLPHILAVENMADNNLNSGEPSRGASAAGNLKGNFEVINIGTGKGHSVLEVANAASEVLGKIIPMEVGPRRAGDPAILIADNHKLKTKLNYTLQFSDLENMVKTSWEGIREF